MRNSTFKFGGLLQKVVLFNLLLLLVLIDFFPSSVKCSQRDNSAESYEDNEFAEFEDDDDEISKRTEIPVTGRHQQQQKQRDNEQQLDDKNDEENDFTHVEEDDDEDVFRDSEEFENGEDAVEKNIHYATKNHESLEITKVPLHLQSNWTSYYIEFLMIAGLLVYFINFIIGRNKNSRIANLWLDVHRDLLDKNFALVGDDGKKEIENQDFIKETENVFSLWCSGRVNVISMMIEIRLIKRHDLVSMVGKMLQPAYDQIIASITISPDAMDNYVFCVANKKTSLNVVKNLCDIDTYCPDKRSLSRFDIGEEFVLFNEIGEVANIVFDSVTLSWFNKFYDCIDFIHISDKYSGPKIVEDTQSLTMPQTRKVLIVAFRYPKGDRMDEESMQKMEPMMHLIFYLLEKTKRVRLSKEGKLKSDKNRQREEEKIMKRSQAVRQEAAQAKREERRRLEKEKILNEDNPEKQRKWEEREHRKEMKKKVPKMKQLKVKAM